ncbi:MAG: hypothetical protein NVS1B6_00920 [Steroidobacteraceae bacterium]
MALNSPRYRRVFAAVGATGTFRTAAGVGGAKLIRVPDLSLRMTPMMPKTEIPWLTGTRSRQPGILGRKSATWSMSNVPIIPSGVGGTPPDMDPLLQNIFGQAPTGSSYSFLDTGYLPLTIFDFPHGTATLTNRLIWGAFVTDFTITLNQNVLTMSLNGTGGYLLDTDNFANEDVVAKAGLGGFPAEPGAPATAGNIIPGFGATLTVDGQAGLATKVRTMTIRGQTGYQVIGDVMSDAYGVVAVGGTRIMSTTMGFMDDDTATLADLKTKAKSNTSVAFSLVVGTIAGSIVTITGQNLQLIPQDMVDEQNIVMSNFPESTFHASAIGVTDDLAIAFS